MQSNRTSIFITLVVVLTWFIAAPAGAQVNPGDVITRDNAPKVAGLVSPGNLLLVQQGMTMRIVPTGQLDWPPPYKAATEKYSPQVSLTSAGELKNYVAGLPFPVVDANDPQAATKIVWNFAFRPEYTDDIDAQNVDIVSHDPASADAIEHFSLGHMGLYKYVGRTEVAPVPVDKDVFETGIAFRAGAYPFLEPAEFRGAGIIMQGSVRPGIEDVVWEYSSATRRLRRLPATQLSDAFGVSRAGAAGSQSGGGDGAATYASTLDPDSSFGFAGKIEDFNFKLLGEQLMLASVEAENSPAEPCVGDGGRSVCPESWEIRHLYVIEATAKPRPTLGADGTIPKRILYIDSEGWFITASDQFDRRGELWKTIVTFNAYRDRPVPDAKVAIWPFKRMFETALVDEDVTSGFSTVLYSPGTDRHGDGWYINMGLVDKSFFTPEKMVQAGH
jgi:Protein of unknown function (DUF1329)